MAENQEEKAYSPEQITAIERSLSAARFNSYVIDAGGDKDKAVRLYEHNTEVSEALYGVIQGLEVTLRNSMDRILKIGIGSENWYDCVHLQDTEAESLRLAKKAVEDLKKVVTPPRVIAKINFGFWVRLTASIYEKELWVPHLYKIFPMKMMRSLLNKRLLKIKELRNQIAHHERISKRNLETDYKEILETVKWLCPTTSNWIRSTTRFDKI